MPVGSPCPPATIMLPPVGREAHRRRDAVGEAHQLRGRGRSAGSIDVHGGAEGQVVDAPRLRHVRQARAVGRPRRARGMRVRVRELADIAGVEVEHVHLRAHAAEESPAVRLVADLVDDDRAAAALLAGVVGLAVVGEQVDRGGEGDARSPSGLHTAAPAAIGRWVRCSASPPATGRVHSCPSRRNASVSPSGENTGASSDVPCVRRRGASPRHPSARSSSSACPPPASIPPST